MNNLVVKTEKAVINSNFEEVKESLVSNLEKYKGLIVSDDTLKDCKSMQKNLAGLRNNIDGYRKSVKAELQEPIKAFEEQCKELIGLIKEVEEPIKLGITAFDDKRRQEKVMAALEYLNTALESNGINDKYKLRISIHDIKINLTNSIKSIKEEIDTKVLNLKNLQEAEEREKELIKNTLLQFINTVNEDINTKVTYSEFAKFVEDGWSVDKVMNLINSQVKKIKEAEKPKEPVQEKVIVQEPIQEVIKEPANEVIPGPVEEVEKFFVNLRITDSKDKIQALKQFLISNNIKFELVGQGRC